MWRKNGKGAHAPVHVRTPTQVLTRLCTSTLISTSPSCQLLVVSVAACLFLAQSNSATCVGVLDPSPLSRVGSWISAFLQLCWPTSTVRLEQLQLSLQAPRSGATVVTQAGVLAAELAAVGAAIQRTVL
eukprot:278788-Pelagomonas_calceolata.AAC.5